MPAANWFGRERDKKERAARKFPGTEVTEVEKRNFVGRFAGRIYSPAVAAPG